MEESSLYSMVRSMLTATLTRNAGRWFSRNRVWPIRTVRWRPVLFQHDSIWFGIQGFIINITSRYPCLSPVYTIGIYIILILFHFDSKIIKTDVVKTKKWPSIGHSTSLWLTLACDDLHEEYNLSFLGGVHAYPQTVAVGHHRGGKVPLRISNCVRTSPCSSRSLQQQQ